jgi:hypothetical protein
MLRRIRLNEVGFFDTKMLLGQALYQKKHPKNPLWYFEAVAETAYTAFTDKYPPKTTVTLDRTQSEIVGPIYFDFLPTSETSFVVFIWWKKQIHVWSAVALKSKRESEEYDIHCTEDKDQLFAVDFEEPFQVFGNDRTWYFVTNSGKVYCSPKPEATRARASTRRSCPTRPIRRTWSRSRTEACS